jgi:hypothetical protein
MTVQFSYGSVALIAALGIGCGGEDRGPALRLSVFRGYPVVLFQPDSGLVARAAAITYDEFGGIQSYTVEIIPSGGDTTHVEVFARPRAGSTGERTFTARRSSGDTLQLAEPDTLVLAVGLHPAEAGGIIARAQATSFTTDLAYDDFGRQQVSRQAFQHGATRWQVDFREYRRDSGGRILSYVGRFSSPR